METKICLFRPESSQVSLQDFLKKDLKLSHQFIKKFLFSKAYLKKEFSHQDEISLPLDLMNKGLVNPSYVGPMPEILFENENFLALNKPRGVHLHPHFYSDQLNLLSLLRSLGKAEVLNVMPENHEKGWLYRLDRETSGVVVAAKNQETYDLYRKNFSKLVKQKSYLCLVRGECKLEGPYSLYYRAHSKKGSLVSASYDQTVGERGDFVIQKLLSKDDYHLLQVDLKTGLRHQIRAGLKFLGFPILGDELYGGENGPRLMLHAFRYRLHRDKSDDLVLTSLSLADFNSFLNLDGLLEMLSE